MPQPRYEGVLFDLDGTLLDTAPDFVDALNRLLHIKTMPPLPDQLIRSHVSHGARALVALAFGDGREDFESLRQEFLDIYAKHLSRKTRLFDGFEALLARLVEHDLPWGIVTNKPERYTLMILDALRLDPAPATVICPDHVSRTKPDPEPMLLAASQLGVAPDRCVYVGDHRRDIEAGRAAGMTTIAAVYGYIDANDPPKTWGADHLAERPGDLLSLLFNHHAQPEDLTV